MSKLRPWLSLGCATALLLLHASIILRPSPISKPTTTHVHHHNHSVPEHDDEQAATLHTDEPSCLSRTQLMHLRRSSSPHKLFPDISPALQQEWEKYVEMHRRCRRNLTAEAMAEKSSAQLASHGEKEECKFLVYIDGTEGLGNRFLSLATAWMYALLTRRVLLIDTRREMQRLLCEPFPGSTWLLPHDFVYDVSSWPSLGSILPPSSADSFQGTHDTNFTFPAALNLYLRHDQGYGDCQLFCDHVQGSLTQVPWISWLSNLYLIPHLHLVPSLWQKMADLFPSPQNTFDLISRLLLLPSNDIWSLVVHDYSAHLSLCNTKVGVQIRKIGYGGYPAPFSEEALHSILECLVQNRFLPNITTDHHESKNNSSAGNFTNEAMANTAASADGNEDEGFTTSRSRESSGTPVDVGLQVVSLQGQYSEGIGRLYNRSGYGAGTRVRVHTMCSLGNQDGSFEQAKLAYAEMLLLSLTDKLATSASSTFGYMGQSWGNVPPLILDFGEKEGNVCRKAAQSTDPCTHDPLVPPCLQLIKSGDGQSHPMVMNSSFLAPQHRKWLTDHLHFCQDRPSAWQLVDAKHAHLYPAVFLYHEKQ